MQYTIPEINNGVAKVQFGDGTWTFVELASPVMLFKLTSTTFVHHITPPHLKTGTTPSFLSAGATRTAAPKPVEQTVDQRPQWEQDRMAAYWNTGKPDRVHHRELGP